MGEPFFMEITVIAISAVLIVKEFVHYKERYEMLDRLMAKNLPEFKDNVKEEENDYGKEDENLIDIEEAREEIENG